jgi:hypothetical protein
MPSWLLLSSPVWSFSSISKPVSLSRILIFIPFLCQDAATRCAARKFARSRSTTHFPPQNFSTLYNVVSVDILEISPYNHAVNVMGETLARLPVASMLKPERIFSVYLLVCLGRPIWVVIVLLAEHFDNIGNGLGSLN